MSTQRRFHLPMASWFRHGARATVVFHSSQRFNRGRLRISKGIYGAISLLVVLWILIVPGVAPVPAAPVLGTAAFSQAESADHLLQQGRTLYEAEQYEQAVMVLQQASQIYGAQEDVPRQALALSNLSLVHQQLGQWAEANTAIQQSLLLLQAGQATRQARGQLGAVLAQALDIQGRLYLAQGQAEAALEAWQRATQTFEQIGDPISALETQINQAQALQILGLYRRSIQLLTHLTLAFADQPPSLRQVVALRSLAEALLVTGDLPRARQALEQSLQHSLTLAHGSPPESAQTTAIQTAIASVYLGLGNLTRAEAIAHLNLAGLTPTEALQVLQTPSSSPSDLPATNSANSTATLSQAATQRRLTAIAQTFIQETEPALDWYQQAMDASPGAQTRIQAQIKQFNLQVETYRWDLATASYPEIQAQINRQPVGRSRIYNQVEFAQSLLALHQGKGIPELSWIAESLALAHQQSEALKDNRVQSHVLGTIGELYEIAQQFPAAQKLTQQALGLAQSVNAPDVAYRWQWQLGRLLNIQGDRAGAIVAYEEAVETLQSLRNDLVAVNRDVQFSFRERVEPVYRELVSLLLQPSPNQSADLDQLVKARDVIEGLQVAELDNFFREACLDTEFRLDRVVDQSSLSTAIFYTIVLPDRIELILKLPQRSLQRYTTYIDQTTVENTVDQLLNELKRPLVSQSLRSLAGQMYDWLIRPAEAALQESQVATLVFVLDGSLRSIPISALYDGRQYLVESYSVALAPGLQLPAPTSIQPEKIQALVAGLSESRNNFPPLSFVTQEVEQIQADLPSQVLFNQNFTRERFQQAMQSTPFSIVHIATHGQFSSNAAETFILTWDQPLTVNELSQVLQTKELNSPEPIELLVLSACQTAVGDRRATLGLAGMAVRAGARSTIASLWNLDDDSSAQFMSQFYQALISAPSTAAISKAEALRQAQQALLANPQYQAPRFWAPYVLLGNWL